MADNPTDWFRQLFPRLAEGCDLAPEQMRLAVGELIAGRFAEWEAAAFLTALRVKGETGAEIAAAAAVLRERMVRLEAGGREVLDTCGTGGDGSGTFNVSTAAALVAAGAGVPVVKHGNRSVSGRSGSADVLRELGVPVEAGPEWAARCLERTGFAFCFAPHFHPAMANVAALRRKLGVRTLFNLLGPLANPAGARYQLIGVGREELLPRLAEALARLGTRRAFLVYGRDGTDEVSLSAPNRVIEVSEGRLSETEWTARDFGLEPCGREALCAE
ncbi:MAG TPA: anthranilate phosphoribosyltransferase, partial [Gemmataceae bacterium]